MQAEDLQRLVTTSMPFGKHKGTLIADLPGNYLNWFARVGFPPGEIGRLRHVDAAFSFCLEDMTNIRNRPETGGGALYDSRFGQRFRGEGAFAELLAQRFALASKRLVHWRPATISPRPRLTDNAPSSE